MRPPAGPQPGAQVFGLLTEVSPVGSQVLGAKTGGLPLESFSECSLKTIRLKLRTIYETNVKVMKDTDSLESYHIKGDWQACH